MGGQACVLYGAAEFSRDTDLALLASDANLDLLRVALRELQAKRIALPPFERRFLQRGHAIHFRSYHPDSFHMRIDVMAVMRGVDSFDKLWLRRTTVTTPEAATYEIMSLPDLVQAKKTQRSKDWEMIRRLVEADYVRVSNPTDAQVEFWLKESRTPEMLVELSKLYPEQTLHTARIRPLLRQAAGGDLSALRFALEREQQEEMERDREYWLPLRKELEELRHSDIPAEEPV